MTPELIAEGMKRELVRFINAERKKCRVNHRRPHHFANFHRERSVKMPSNFLKPT